MTYDLHNFVVPGENTCQYVKANKKLILHLFKNMLHTQTPTYLIILHTELIYNNYTIYNYTSIYIQTRLVHLEK